MQSLDDFLVFWISGWLRIVFSIGCWWWSLAVLGTSARGLFGLSTAEGRHGHAGSPSLLWGAEGVRALLSRLCHHKPSIAQELLWAHNSGVLVNCKFPKWEYFAHLRSTVHPLGDWCCTGGSRIKINPSVLAQVGRQCPLPRRCRWSCCGCKDWIALPRTVTGGWTERLHGKEQAVQTTTVLLWRGWQEVQPKAAVRWNLGRRGLGIVHL